MKYFLCAGCQRLFMRGFRFQSGLFGQGVGFGPTCRPPADPEHRLRYSGYMHYSLELIPL